MLRSIAWYIFFFISVLISVPSMIKTKSLNKKGLKKRKGKCFL